jgi:hypothetical protein
MPRWWRIFVPTVTMWSMWRNWRPGSLTSRQSSVPITSRILLTEDKDFGELVVRRRLPVPGLVLLRIDPRLRAIKRSRLERAIQKFGEGLFGRYLIIDEIRLRVRSLGSRD